MWDDKPYYGDDGILITGQDENGEIIYASWQRDFGVQTEKHYLENSTAYRETVAFGMSIDITFALGPFGFSVEFGSLEYEGNNYNFFSIGHAAGIEATASFNVIDLRENSNNKFSPQDMSGKSGTMNFPGFYLGYSREASHQYIESSNINDGYRSNLFSLGAGFGASYVTSYTWCGKKRIPVEYKFYDYK